MSANALRALHAPGELLVLPNAWDVLSAKLVVQAGARAVATSSAALAWALGVADGQRLSLSRLVEATRAMAAAVAVPLTVDFEQGYADAPETAAANVEALVEVGAVGVNLEDGAADPALLEAKLRAIRRRLGPERVFLNARTCVVLRGTVRPEDTAREVLARAARYADAGADGLFVPRLADAQAIRTIAEGTPLPLNVMAVPGLPEVPQLRALGVRRLSVGPRLAEVAYGAALQAARGLLEQGALGPLLEAPLGYPTIQGLFTA
jgi:2-methylisocitrate lyase-like PEP mutase family enzyme